MIQYLILHTFSEEKPVWIKKIKEIIMFHSTLHLNAQKIPRTYEGSFQKKDQSIDNVKCVEKVPKQK